MFGPFVTATKRIFVISSLLGSARLATTSLCCRSLVPNLTSLTCCSRKPRQSGGGRRGLPSSTRASPSELQIRTFFAFGFVKFTVFFAGRCPPPVQRRSTRRKWKSRASRKHLQATTVRTSCSFRDVVELRLEVFVDYLFVTNISIIGRSTTTTQSMMIC